MGTNHLRSLLETSRCRVRAWDVDGAARHAVRERLGVETYETWEELLGDPDVAGIIIAAPNRFHADMAVAALEHGKHVLLEKPMALNEPDAERVASAAERSGKILHVGFELRNSLFPLDLKDLIASGELGPLVSGHLVEYRGNFWPQWKGARCDGGSMYLMESCHIIDLFRWLTGDEVETIHAVGSRRNIVRHYDYPDTQFTTLVFRNAFVGHIHVCHTRAAIPHGYENRGPDSPPCTEFLKPEYGHQYEFSFVGENGSLHFLPLKKVCHLYTHELRPDGAVWQRLSRTIDYSRFADHKPTIHNTGDEVAEFVAMVLGERGEAIAPRDALMTHLVCFAAQEALEKGVPVQMANAPFTATAEPLSLT